MGKAIHNLPILADGPSADDQLAINSKGTDFKAPVNSLPISKATQAELDRILELAVEPNVVYPTDPAYGAVLDGTTVSTQAFQAAQTAAKSTPIPKTGGGSFGYGYGGKVRIPCGVLRTGPTSRSRSVGMEGSGALASTTILSDYTALGGIPGEDSFLTVLSDGTSEGGITQQHDLVNIAFDGDSGKEPTGHIRHCLNYTDPDDGTDRLAAVTNVHVMNFPGAAWKSYANGQVRGSNFKATGNKWGLYWEKVKDGKFDQIGLGKNVSGNVLSNCASLKLSKVDIWTGPNSDGSPVLSMISCAKSMLSDGEIEGMVLAQGDNADTSDKSYREQTSNVFLNINFKVSEDFYDAAGAGNMSTGAGYVALIKIVDCNGVRLANCTGKYKLGLPESSGAARYLNYTPNCFVWFGTSIPSSDPQYLDWLAACGDADVTGSTFIWHAGKGTPGRRSIPIVPFKEHISNIPSKLKGLRLGRITLRPTGNQHQDEIPLDGATYTSDYYPLLYLVTDPNWGALSASRRSLLDRDPSGPGADPTTGYKTFTVPTLTAPAGYTYYMVYEQ